MDVYKIRNEILNGKNINDIKLRVVFYARVSTDYDTQLSSLENQVDFFMEYINNNKNWSYCGKYIDEGISGTSTLKRENFNRMINDSKYDRFDLIVTKNVPRFARNTLDSISYTQELLGNNVGVLFLNDNINTFLPDSDLRLAIMASIAQDEVRKLSENVKFGLKKSLDRGIILGGNNLYGYKKIDGKLLPIDEEANQIRRIYELFSTGKYNYSSLNRKLISKNIFDRNNKPFNLCTLKRILTNPKYKGYYCGNKTKKIDYKLKKRISVDKNDWIVYKDENKIIPIVDEKLWNKVNNILSKYKINNSKDGGKIYTGKIYCYDHNTHFTRSGKKIWTCKLYKKGKKYCKSPLLKEDDLNLILKKILLNKKDKETLKQSYIKRYYKFFNFSNNNIYLKISDFLSKEDIIKNIIDKIVVKKIDADRKKILLYIFTSYKKNMIVKYLK